MPELPGEFDGFLDDEEEEEEEDDPYKPDRCLNVSIDEFGNEVECGNLKNPAEQFCHDCRLFGHRITGFL